MENSTEYGKSSFITICILLLGVILIFSLTSCSTTYGLSTEQIKHRDNIDYELDKLYLEYSYQRDSLIMEFYKK